MKHSHLWTRVSLLLLLLALLSPQGSAAPGTVPSSTLPEVADPPFVFDRSLPAADPVSMDWFSDAAFIGGNQTAYLMNYQPLQAGAWFTRDDISASNLASATFSVDGRELRFAEALRESGCTKVYLMLGPGPVEDDAAFVRVYSDLVAVIRSALPHAQIYLQTFLPVTAAWAASTGNSNETFRHRNDLLGLVAREKGVYLVDVYAALADETWALPAPLSTDGLYLTVEGQYLWVEYLRSHTMGT